ncbi:MAG: hypothetical protein ACK4YQ_15805 [Phenylobacterium sp.]|uniref:hypothetical protein n=1 Tax=Phenylobacterium sp. TaxID=1871053 RepID=UPI00391C693A
MPHAPRVLAAAALAALAAAGAALASTPDAWAAFRVDVRERCLAAGRAQGMSSPQVVVHPFGTQSYGVAVLIEGGDKRICVYDKRAKQVELTPQP